jgi:putative flippase GtrA
VTGTSGRLIRYGISGCASAVTHFGVGLALPVRPVVASTAGFAASVLVSYALQHAWVFRSAAPHRVAGARFLTVTTVAFLLNLAIVGAGTGPLGGTYPVAQAVALVAIPAVNYALHSRWTFRVS